MRSSGARRSMTTSPWLDSRARSSRSAASISLRCVGEIERAAAPDVDVEAGQRRRDVDVERLADAAQADRQHARRLERARHAGGENRAGLDLDDVMRARAHEADFDMRSLSRRKRA